MTYHISIASGASTAYDTLDEVPPHFHARIKRLDDAADEHGRAVVGGVGIRCPRSPEGVRYTMFGVK